LVFELTIFEVGVKVSGLELGKITPHLEPCRTSEEKNC
jgi:hypothetical protein